MKILEIKKKKIRLKAWPIFTGLAVAMMVETTDSNAELADSTNNSIIVSQLHNLTCLFF